jgi:hypothetical protein
MEGKALIVLLAAALIPLPAFAGTEGRAESATLADRLADDYGIELAGFIELRNGWRLVNDPYEKEASLAEARMLLDLARDFGAVSARFKGELGADLVDEEAITGIREASLAFSPLEKIDLKVGRQVITWGTGDLLFINDHFPKDWVSFFTGRDDEYLKAPSDAVKASFFSDLADLDLVYSPLAIGSVYIDGSRLSYWNGMLGRTAGRDAVLDDEERNSWFTDFELAGRLSRNFAGTELALYAYHGFWKTPEGFAPASGRLFYPRLNVWGASIRGNLLGGIGNLEAGWYDSKDDQDGGNPLIRNSELRFLAGFERELSRDFTGGVQYYLERILDHDRYLAALPTGSPAADENRHLLTIRLTRLLLGQNLRLSLFAYYSPSDRDFYLRPKAHYKLTDQWSVEAGANLFGGADDHTFFGQFDRSTNLYAGARYSF